MLVQQKIRFLLSLVMLTACFCNVNASNPKKPNRYDKKRLRSRKELTRPAHFAADIDETKDTDIKVIESTLRAKFQRKDKISKTAERAINILNATGTLFPQINALVYSLPETKQEQARLALCQASLASYMMGKHDRKQKREISVHMPWEKYLNSNLPEGVVYSDDEK